MNRARIIRLLLAATLMAAAGWVLRGYITDDTYIHLRYAQNLIDRGEFSFNPGQGSYGATSPLWIFGLAILLKIGMPPFAAAWVLGCVSGVTMILIMDSILERMTFHPIWKGALLVLATSDVWFLRWSYSGMETPLATAFLLLLLWPLVSGRDLGWGVTREALWMRYLGWGVTAGLAGLIRPEFMILAPLALPWLLWFEYFRAGSVGGLSGRHKARPHRPLLAAISGWSLVVVPWLVYAWFAFGRITPGTAAAKSSSSGASITDILQYFGMSLKQLAATQGILWLVLLALVVLVLIRNSRDLETIWEEVEEEANSYDKQDRLATGQGPWSVWGPVTLLGIAVTWFFVLLGGYAVKQVWIISRYVSPLAPVILLAMGVLAEWLINGQRLGPRGLRVGNTVLAVGVIFTLAGNAWIFSTMVVPHAQKFPEGVRECYLGMGEWLSENTHEEAVIAALDIGAVGYASERRVLDLMGLVSPEILALGQEIGFQEMVASGAWLQTEELGSGRRPDYFVDRSEGLPRWEGKTVNGVRFELIDTCILEGVGLREPQPWTVALYKLVSVGKSVTDSAGG
ncbi:MAG: hypothetical protein GY780_11860 [bacterium]|nr:hypothetical protein [bacterium]